MIQIRYVQNKEFFLEVYLRGGGSSISKNEVLPFEVLYSRLNWSRNAIRIEGVILKELASMITGLKSAIK